IPPPLLNPCFPRVLARERKDAMLRKLDGLIIATPKQQLEQPRQVREMTGDKCVPRLAAQPIPHPGGRVIRLQIPCGRTFSEWIAGAPERLSRLARPQLAAVPDHGRFRAP